MKEISIEDREGSVEREQGEVQFHENEASLIMYGDGPMTGILDECYRQYLIVAQCLVEERNRGRCLGWWKKDVTFHEGLSTGEDLDVWFGPTKGGLLVVDDLMEESGNSKNVFDLFNKYSHHRSITLMFLS